MVTHPRGDHAQSCFTWLLRASAVALCLWDTHCYLFAELVCLLLTVKVIVTGLSVLLTVKVVVTCLLSWFVCC